MVYAISKYHFALIFFLFLQTITYDKKNSNKIKI